MKKKKVTVLASILISLSFLSLPLTGQTAARTEVRAVKPIEETRPGKPAIHEPGKWPESGKLQLRAAARPWPDSTVTFTSAGERQSKSIYTYDASGNQTLSEGYRWENGAWVNSSKTAYSYDAAGNRILYEGYSWESGTWINSSKSVATYDAAGHQTLYESYRWENNQWTGSYKNTNIYDSRGEVILYGQYNWTNNTWVKYREEYYDRKTTESKTYIDVSVFYNDDGSRHGTALFVTGSGLNWAVVMMEEYISDMEYQATYDANGNLIRVETTGLSRSAGKRVPFERYVLKYSNNNPVSIEVYGYYENDISSQATYKATNTYDAWGNRTLSESYSWEGNPAEWIGLNRQINTYDANGRELSYEYYDWDASSGGWKGNNKHAHTYDTNGNILSEEYYSWDTSSGGWKGNWKYTFTYDANGKQLSTESYNWDTSSGGWIGSWKDTNEERNEYGDVILRKSWEWKNSGWEWTSYTVSYPGGSGPSGTEYIGGAEPSVYIHGDMLQIQTVSAERIGIYTLDGAKVYESAVPPGTTTISAERLPKGILIVRGSSGWARKVFAR
jgi:hypothetical protein